MSVMGLIYLLLTKWRFSERLQRSFLLLYSVLSKKNKDKAKIKLSFAPEQAMKTYRGSRLWFYSFFNLSARWEWVVNATPQPFCSRERPYYRRLGDSQGLSGRVRKISSPTGIRSLDLPGSSASLYSLRYHGHGGKAI